MGEVQEVEELTRRHAADISALTERSDALERRHRATSSSTPAPPTQGGRAQHAIKFGGWQDTLTSHAKTQLARIAIAAARSAASQHCFDPSAPRNFKAVDLRFSSETQRARGRTTSAC